MGTRSVADPSVGVSGCGDEVHSRSFASLDVPVVGSRGKTLDSRTELGSGVIVKPNSS